MSHNGNGQEKQGSPEQGQVVGQPKKKQSKKERPKKQQTEAEKLAAEALKEQKAAEKEAARVLKAQNAEEKRLAKEAHKAWLQTPEGQKHVRETKDAFNKKAQQDYTIKMQKYRAGELPPAEAEKIKTRLDNLSANAKERADEKTAWLNSDEATDDDRQKHQQELDEKNAKRRETKAVKKAVMLAPDTPADVAAKLRKQQDDTNTRSREWYAKDQLKEKTPEQLAHKAGKATSKNTRRREAYAVEHPKPPDLTEEELAEMMKTDPNRARQIKASQNRRKKYAEEHPKDPRPGTPDLPVGSPETEKVAGTDGDGSKPFHLSTKDVKDSLASIVANPQMQSMLHSWQMGVQGMSFQQALQGFNPRMLTKVRPRPLMVV